jgi:PLP dependent protein
MNMATYYGEVARNVREKVCACGRRPEEVSLIAVSKTCSVEAIQSVYQEGGREFGESRIQEALDKIPYLPKDCKWHFIGTLQSNKVGKAISSFQLIHSIDTPSLVQKISQMSQAKGVTTSILLQVNTSGEKSKHGLSAEEWQRSLEEVNQLSHISIEGLMTMAPFTEDQQIIRFCFRKLYQLREMWRREMKNPMSFQHLSMGMSHDYLIAIEEGATLLRIGSAIFGLF